MKNLNNYITTLTQ